MKTIFINLFNLENDSYCTCYNTLEEAFKVKSSPDWEATFELTKKEDGRISITLICNTLQSN